MTRSGLRGAALLALALGTVWLTACSPPPPKPLPGGPPPEYEKPRSYDLDGPAAAAPTSSPAAEEPVPGVPAAPTSSGPGAPRPAPDPAKPGDPQAAPPN